MSVSKRVRFEVLKRDKFTCQYCGRPAPDVILQVDHIHPVSKNGEDEPYNLITSCHDCNIGKSNLLLRNSFVLFRSSYLYEIYKIRSRLASRFTFNENDWDKIIEFTELVFLTQKRAGRVLDTYFDSLNSLQRHSMSIDEFMLSLSDEYYEALGMIEMKRLGIDNWNVFISVVRFIKRDCYV